MKDILTAPFIVEICRTCENMYRLGWDERNSGNISLLLDECEVQNYLDTSAVLRKFPLGFDASSLSGRYFLATATGQYFKNTSLFPAGDLGIFRVSKDGQSGELLWGLEGSGAFTSELPTHLLSHKTRLEKDPLHRVIMHCHPTHLQAMTFVPPLSDKAFSHSLWQMCTESIAVFPEGVGVLPWMVCGTEEIGRASAEKMREFRLVIWSMHGVYGAGRSLDDAFGLIETVEKSAQIYMLTSHLPRVNTITDDNLRAMAEYWGKNYRKDFLD